MKTAIYVRVSTEEQVKEGYSIRAQIEKLKNYIQIKEWEFYKVYADEGISGKNITDRPAINELIADIKAGNVNNVLVYKIDRLTRSTKDLIDLTTLFKENNCAFNSVMESIDTSTASGRMFLKIIGIFAEFERENLIERISFACEKKVKEGYTLSSYTSSYGYDRAKGEKVQTINPEEVKIVREIFSMYLDGNMSVNAITINLNHRHIKPKLSSSWKPGSVHMILTNANYIGKVRYSMWDKERYFEAEGKHEPILTEEIFYAVQNKMGKIKRKTRTKMPKSDNYYSGILYCGICGAKLGTHAICGITKNSGEKVWGQYRCPNTIIGLCNNATISHRKIEAAFQAYMNDIEDLKVTDDVQFEKNSQQTALNTLLREECDNAITKLTKKGKDLMAHYINDEIPFAEYTQMNKMIENEKNGYIKQLEGLSAENEVEAVTISSKDIITNFKENWDLLTNAERLEFMQNYIEKITVVSKKKEKYQVKILDVKFDKP